MKKLISIITIVLGLTSAVMATDYTWTGPLTGGTWNSYTNNWSAGCPGWSYESNSIPALTNIAVFNTSGLQAMVSGTVYPNGLRVRGGSQLTIPNGASVTNTSWLSLNGNSKILLGSSAMFYTRASGEGLNSDAQQTTSFTFASADAPSAGGTVMLENTADFWMNRVNISSYKMILDNVSLLNNSGSFQIARGGSNNSLVLTNSAKFTSLRTGQSFYMGIDAGQQTLMIFSNSVMNLANGYLRMRAGGVHTKDHRIWINGGTLTNFNSFVYGSELPLCNIAVTNQGKVFSIGTTTIDGSNCITRVSGTNSLWYLTGGNLVIGTSARSYNRVEVDNAGALTNIGTLTVDGTNVLSLASGGMLCATNVDLKNGGALDLLEGGVLIPPTGYQTGLFNATADATLGNVISSDGKGVFNAKGFLFRAARYNASGVTCLVSRVAITNAGNVEIVRGGLYSTTIFTNGASVVTTGGNASYLGVDGDYASLYVYDNCVLQLGNSLIMHAGTSGAVGRHKLVVSGGLVTNVMDVAMTYEPTKRPLKVGTIQIDRGGRLYSKQNSSIDCSNGVVVVSGNNSLWDMNNSTLTIGGAGLGGNELQLAAGGMLSRAKIVLTPTQLVNRVSFDGGILKAGSAGTLISGSGTCLIKTNGAIIDSAGFTVTNMIAMTEDPTSTGGGFTKLGAGTLTLATGTLYTGSTTVSNGTLVVSGSFLSDTADVYVSSNAVLNLNFIGTDTIRNLYIGGVLQERARSYGSSHASGCFLGSTGFIKPLEGTPPSGTIIRFM